MKKSITVLIILMLVPAASANIFTDVFNKLVPYSQPLGVNNTQSVMEDDFDSLMAQIYQLNTPANIQILSKKMQHYGINAIKIGVTDYNKNFYVVKDYGILEDYPTSNIEITVSKAQIDQVKHYIADGKITPYEQFRMWMIYKDLL
ncbi:hypothetical protein ANME2D_03347 [Candidatus Methanoperedens nitroreducens]|uniref:Uncharacterized protein n=1 Tax=Candidatus Methanoperedens nitratireducens TaxID=1392998 RepID=A0A062UZ85_9EURY|nr:hypothetical protein [Candidatus Methanoperedens nitroreducens]KCZ70432.1 hypothetical protein ANME2D_03347 [Candidatus Methanoperedens nitroreducens]MDJ1420871.1 hypothetical protein [Candidatus Methanoperedens sp.]